MHIHPSMSSVFLRLPSSSRDINHISAIARRRLARRRVRSSSLPRPLERIPRHASVVPTSLLESHAPHRRRSRRHRSNASDIIRASAGPRGANLHSRIKITLFAHTPQKKTTDAPRHGSIQVGGDVRARGPVGARARARLRARASALGRGGRHRAGEGACGGKHLV